MAFDAQALDLLANPVERQRGADAEVDARRPRSIGSFALLGDLDEIRTGAQRGEARHALR